MKILFRQVNRIETGLQFVMLGSHTSGVIYLLLLSNIYTEAKNIGCLKEQIFYRPLLWRDVCLISKHDITEDEPQYEEARQGYINKITQRVSSCMLETTLSLSYTGMNYTSQQGCTSVIKIRTWLIFLNFKTNSTCAFLAFWYHKKWVQYNLTVFIN